MKKILTVLLLLCIAGCQNLTINTGKHYTKVENSIRNYYTNKYPEFAAITLLQKQKTNINNSKIENKLKKLLKLCPVSAIPSSYHTYMTFIEKNELSKSTISVVTIDLYVNRDKTCKVKVHVSKRKKRKGIPYSTKKAISKTEIKTILDQIQPSLK